MHEQSGAEQDLLIIFVAVLAALGALSIPCCYKLAMDDATPSIPVHPFVVREVSRAHTLGSCSCIGFLLHCRGMSF